MTSITDVYEGDVRRVASRRRRLVGSGIFAVGAGMIVAAIVMATTTVGVGTFGQFGAREIAGVLAGVGLPAVVLGVFAVLPASRATRAAAIIGASLAVLGVALFQQAYPYNWIQNDPLFALATTGVYFAGVGTTFWCLFVALATFKTRRDPGGTATMEVTEEGRLRLVEESPSIPGMGGVGLFGSSPDGEVATQTNRPSAGSGGAGGSTTGSAGVSSGTGGATVMKDDSGTVADDGTSATSTQGSGRTSGPTAGPSAGPTADGGSATVGSGSATVGSGSATVGSGSAAGNATSGATGGSTGADPAPDVTDDAEFLDAAQERGRPDAYCGNCEHFEYVKVDGDIEPYCGFTGTRMDDMDACEEWSPNDSV